MATLPRVLQRFFDAWSMLDSEGYIGMFAENFVLRDPLGVTDTREGLAEHMAVSRANWERLEYRVDQILEVGNKIAMNFAAIMTGRQGTPWAGQTVELTCMVFAEIEGGLITRWDEAFDTAVLRRAAKRG